MKKITVFVMGLILALSLCACACANNNPASEPSVTTTPTTEINRMPTDTMTIPVPETNVPDTGVDDDTLPGGIPGGDGATGGNGTLGGSSNGAM